MEHSGYYQINSGKGIELYRSEDWNRGRMFVDRQRKLPVAEWVLVFRNPTEHRTEILENVLLSDLAGA